MLLFVAVPMHEARSSVRAVGTCSRLPAAPGMLCSRGRCSLCWAVPPGLKPDSLANASVRDVGHLLPSRVRISPVLVAEEKFLPSGKLQPVGEPLCLFICKKSRPGSFLFLFCQFPAPSISVKNVSFNAFS